MSRGAFGRCELCWATIPADQLEAIPTTRLCLRCEQRRRRIGTSCARP
ncbi:TraR/DksA C4-type zinc finger protein [Kribbella sp. NPDC059898]